MRINTLIPIGILATCVSASGAVITHVGKDETAPAKAERSVEKHIHLDILRELEAADAKDEPSEPDDEITDLRRAIEELEERLGSRGKGTSETARPPAQAKPHTPRVILYGADWCPACRQQKAAFKSANLPFTVEYSNASPPSGNTIPQTWIETAPGKWIHWTGVVNPATVERQWRQSTRDSGSRLSSDLSELTPWSAVSAGLKLANLQAGQTFADYGCGSEARWLIAAARDYGCRGIGVEIDPQKAEQARQAVAEAGLSDRIEIITGDAREVDIDADVGVVYLFPNVLADLVPQLTSMERFISYRHSVPGLDMEQRGEFYVWGEVPEESQQKQNLVRMAKYGGSYYTGRVCNSRNCGMCNRIAWLLKNKPVFMPAEYASNQTRYYSRRR